MSLGNLFRQASALHREGRLREAEDLYRRLLHADPSSFSAYHMLGLLLAQDGRAAQSLPFIAEALKRKPDDPAALVNYANVLSLMGRHKEAVSSYDRALAIAPDAETFKNRGFALQSLGQLAQALASYAKASALDPSDVQALYKQGVLLGELGQSDEALACYDRLLRLAPDHVEALNNRGFILWLNKHDYGLAITDLERAFALDPNLPYLLGAIMHLKMYAADWSDFDRAKKQIVEETRLGHHAARPFMFQALSEDPSELQACARLYAKDLFPPAPFSPHEPSSRAGRSRIRLGYLSGEFRDQATAILMAGLYERHDRRRFEVVAIDNASADKSAMSARLKQAFDSWIDIGGLTDAEAAEKIRAGEIDILVNLNGWFGKHRMSVFARRPAPLQVNYLGFPGTMGVSYMDYIIADQVVIPPEEEDFYDEAVVTLPRSYQVNDDHGRIIAPLPSRHDAGLPEQGFVFVNFNQSYKLTPQTFAGWMRILKKVEGSVLWLLDCTPPFASNIARHAREHGICPQRILFASDQPPPLHLARLALADLFLDGLPYNAHTTGSDALWAGVPLLTCKGSAFAGRVGTSLLMAAGLPELVTHSAQDYEALAVRLARDPKALAGLKHRLKRNCPLFDTNLFRRGIEAAYDRMWRNWLAGQRPKGFAVDEVS
jgi:predicted O-linked N-acetylglucosamine transferase (SPINDLY family)